MENVTSKRLEILKNSLSKKTQNFDEKLNNHFETVRRANGQPLNDKRNGHATMRLWERQNDTLKKLDEGIEKTKRAIENEQSKINHCKATQEKLPDIFLKLMEEGVITQWRKHPRFFFVNGIEKARIFYDFEKEVVCSRYHQTITDSKQRQHYIEVFNKIKNNL